MKVIFLDIDGVLNSDAYDRERNIEAMSNIDESRLPLLKELVDRTGAVIILTSSWRRYWEAAGCRDERGKYISDLFYKYGLKIHGKTEDLGNVVSRGKEIETWLNTHKVERFVIFDDLIYGWGKLSPFWIKTNPRFGRGLEEEHVLRALDLLC